ncbi:histidine kinase/DNA gyrase B/HSP90-like ATPase [Nonomuraea fuscirosea]|uniref:histidine kinase n=1 Tax=Nonomuraea fuscirosea TaxID=1291556 RepID=A0A2T0ME41_9ACTN|nr:ATP-binding protein [Nonomuraea fuscirosea]PRX55810.1 histidine kinase/DNA gyrase B/HSP90-like ATPase [Nonomuraea fuscirosea]
MPVPAWVTERLCGVELFRGLNAEQLEWVARTGLFMELSDGDALFSEGEPADAFYVLLGGQIVVTKMVGGREQVLARHTGDSIEHQFIGELPLLTSAEYLASALAVGSARVVAYDRDGFFEMLERCPPVSRVLLPVLAGRINAMERQAGRSRMLEGLGMLAAGLAHELNNPAAAAMRATRDLRDLTPRLAEAAVAWGRACDDAEWRLVARVQGELTPRVPLDPLAEAEAADEVADWLYERGLVDAADLSDVLAEHGACPARLDELAAGLRTEVFEPALTYLTRVLRAASLTRDAAEAGRRVVELVGRTSAYANLDRAPEREVDLREGLEATLALMAPKLRGVRVRRDYADLPDMKAFPSELNQVWTNLIDNAVDAMNGEGELAISTRREGGHAVVEFRDDGPGIPGDVLPTVFQPFTTTKELGKGTGLGLHVSMDIVAQRHGGTMEVTTRPGETRFVVRLPLSRLPGGSGTGGPEDGAPAARTPGAQLSE